jgi:hypothetical protein
MSAIVWAVQDRSGTVYMVQLAEPLPHAVAVGDSGTYSGLVRGTATSLAFTVSQVNTDTEFCISTVVASGASGEALTTSWPPSGTIVWLTGENSAASPGESEVIATYPANSYLSLDELQTYAATRNIAYADSPAEAVQAAIVLATQYIDTKYRFKGVKVQEWINSPFYTASGGFLDLSFVDYGWFGFGGMYGPGSPFILEASTIQRTQWPRLAVTDLNGNQVWGVAQPIKDATAEAALRVLAGTNLQPDFDAGVFGAAGAIPSETTSTVGPITTRTTWDTKFGSGFFPPIPIIDRILKSSGVLVASGGRSILR